MPVDATRANQALELINVSKYFGDLEALKGVRFQVARGDSVLLFGPNGAGKTTLLRTLASLSHPSEGEVRYGGQDFYKDPQTAKAAIGFVSHVTFLYGELTARENLRFTGKLFGLQTLEEKIDRALELFAMQDRETSPSGSSREGSSSAHPWRAPFFTTPISFCSTSPSPGWTRAPRIICNRSCAACPTRAKQWFSPCTILSWAPAWRAAWSHLKEGRCATTEN